MEGYEGQSEGVHATSDPATDPPCGVHVALVAKVVERFDRTPRRLALLSRLKTGLGALPAAGWRWAYLDGTFVTAKDAQLGDPPSDFDAC